MTLSELLARARARCGADTDAEVARCLGVTRQAVNNWRMGTAFPNWRATEKLATLARVPLETALRAVADERRSA